MSLADKLYGMVLITLPVMIVFAATIWICIKVSKRPKAIPAQK